MEKDKFFTEAFLNECENELVNQFRQIHSIEPFAHPLAKNEQERELSKLFYNRILFLLWKGNRITKETFIKESFIVGDWNYALNG